MKVIEIFRSIQGEGYHTGTAAVFVRFAGCNLRCPFCDSKYTWKENVGFGEVSPEKLVNIVKDVSGEVRFVVLTGGEPTIQSTSALSDLVFRLKAESYYVAMETNGTKLIDRSLIPVDWLTVSPHTAIFHTQGDELKLVYEPGIDLKFYEQFDFKYFYLQPMAKPSSLEWKKNVLDRGIIQENVEEVAKIVSRDPVWKLSLQTQKYVGIL